jgi:hypothetical protein
VIAHHIFRCDEKGGLGLAEILESQAVAAIAGVAHPIVER